MSFLSGQFNSGSSKAKHPSRKALMEIVLQKCKDFSGTAFDPEKKFNLDDLKQMKKKCLCLIRSQQLLNESKSDYELRNFLQTIQQIVKNIECAYSTQVDSLVLEFLSEFLQEMNEETAARIAEVEARITDSAKIASPSAPTKSFLLNSLPKNELTNLLERDNLPVEYKQVAYLVEHGLIRISGSKRPRNEEFLFSVSKNKKVLPEEELKKLADENLGDYFDTGFTLHV